MSRFDTRAARRAVAFGVLLLQLLLVGAAPYADAHLEAEAYGSSLHIESESSDCASTHDHSACQLCRAIHLAGHPPVHAVPHVFGQSPMADPSALVESRIATTSCTLPLGSRAPPLSGI